MPMGLFGPRTGTNNAVSSGAHFGVRGRVVGLVDFYFVRHERYAIPEIFDPRGIYGAWGIYGLVAYLAGVLAMVPFLVTGFLVGPVAERLGGVDVSSAVGLLVAGRVYYVLTRNRDAAAEEAAVAASEAELARLVDEGRVSSSEAL